VVALPRSPALSTHHSASTATLVLGLLLSVLLAVYLRQKERRQALIEDTVRTRTHDLKQERNFNRAILDSAGVVVMVIDRKAEIIHFNLEAQRLTGCTAEEVVGKPFYWERFLPPDQRADIRVLFERFLAKDIPARLDMPWLDRSGKRHEFDWSTTLLLDDQMAPEYLVTVGIDMTDARKNAEALSRSEARFRQMFEHNNAVMLLIDAQTGDIFDANAAASQFYGWPHEALCHMNISQINRFTDEEVAAERQRAANESRRYFIFPHRLADGSVHTVEVHTTPIDIDGRKMLFSIVHDISERLAAEARVRQLVHEQSIMLDNTLVGIVRAQDRMITWANRAFENMLGYGHGALNGLSTRKLYQDEASYEQFGARAYTAIQVEGNYRGEVKLLRVDGRPIWCDVSGASLEVATGASLWIFLDITDKKRAEDEIRQLAYFDPLTQLPNRRLMTDRLNQALISSQRRGEYGAIMMLDMDQFKGLNDTLGHHMGDLLLQAVSRRLTACVRQQDTVARLGGDEYVVLLEGLGFEDAAAVTRAKQVAEKIRASLSAPYLLGLQNTEYHTTSSIGLTLFLGQENPVDVLLRHADLALYQAKDAGRNTVRFFSPAMQAEIETISAMEAAIRQGLARDEFILHYQPQVDQIGRLVGVEALIRWQSPELGQVPPTEFIPLAEETGLILELGQRLIDTACAQLKRWGESPLSRDLNLSINVSARQFRQVDFVDRLRKSLSDHEANPARLILELTEGTVLKEVDVVVAQMRELTELGVGFSLDDFGTGYSSLSYLKRLPLTQVKIDKSFVRDLAVDPSDEAIVRAILAMSRSLGLQAIAEGVETAEQREFLSENGCVFYQGYLFGRPGPIEDIDRLIGEGTILL
ncbi:MAG: EAL domain-containing protein, partial [Halothiobacillus sp.]